MGSATLAWLLATVMAAEPTGWRHDGSGTWPAAEAPTSWSADTVLWRTPLAMWSNASPVVAGSLVCAAVEPVRLLCVDKDTGVARWHADHPIVDALPEAERPAATAAVARLNQLEAELDVTRTAHSKLLREARRGGADVGDQLAQSNRRMDALKAELDSTTDYRTPPTQGMVGWSSPTPATDGERVFTLFANGVVAAHALDGTLLWQRWLGPMPTRMLGWDEGHAASPVVVGDTLVVPFRSLLGLDPATGATRWEGETWPHYGAPAGAVVDGTPIVLTPSGHAYRASDGTVLREGMADQWYIGPVVQGSWVWFMEARADSIMRTNGGADLIAWTLDGLDGDTLKATKRWTTRVPEDQTFYAAPVVAGEHLYAISHDGRVWTLEARTGTVIGPTVLEPLRPTVIWSSPAVAAGHLYLTNERGQTAVLSVGAHPTIVSVNQLGKSRSSPAFADGRVYLRTEDALIAVE